MTDLRFENAVIVDGSGGAPFRGTVDVSGEMIVRVSTVASQHTARRTVDVRGAVLAPGFIDMHSHSDLELLSDEWPEAKLLQGVTTEVVGQDGFGYAPGTAESLNEVRERLASWNGLHPEVGKEWRTVRDLLSALERSRANAAFLVPHNTVRIAVAGVSDQPLAESQVEAMREVVAQGMSDGAVGMSAGLGYVPGSFSTTTELEQLCSVVASFGGYFAPHHRSYGRNAIGSFRECVDIARTTGVRLHLAHAHMSFQENEHRVEELVDLFELARRDGVDLTFDSYPYDSAMTSLVAQLPSWALVGNTESVLAALTDPPTRERIRHVLEVDGSDGHQGLPVDWSTVVLASAAMHRDGEIGRSLLEIAAMRAVEPWEACLAILVESRLDATCILRVGHEDNVLRLMKLPYHTVGSDGILSGSRPHPRGWGSFARFAGTFVRRGLIDLAEAVRHVTSTPAAVLQRSDLGTVSAGARADLVVFDPATFADRATYDSPRTPATGVEHVLVGGDFAVRSGALTDTRNGKVIRRVP